MRFTRFLLLAFFFAYVAVFTTLPLVILFDWLGLGLGLVLCTGFLASLYFGGHQRIFEQLHLRKLTRAETPELHYMIQEYARRLRISAPSLAVLETEALNIGVFGYTQKNTTLVLTRGILENFSRAQLSALIGRELCGIWYGDVFLATWFARFLYFLESAAGYRDRSKAGLNQKRRLYPLKSLLRQLILLPLALFPRFVLLRIRYSKDLDLASVKLTRLPNELAESYRSIDALCRRLAFRAPFSTGHLFLVRPTPTDPLARALFQEQDLGQQTLKLNALKHVVDLR